MLYSELMADVKRSYHAPVREEQARATRSRIAAAAGERFASSGWVGTTVADIARAAGVTPQAVHQSIGAKPALLIEAVSEAVAGFDSGESAGGSPLREREPFRRAYDVRLPLQERAEAFAAGSRRVYDRAGALFLVLAQTALAEPEVAALWSSARDARLSDCRRLVRSAGHSGRDAEQRADQLFVQSGPGVHSELAGLGWSARAYERWLSEQVARLIA